MEFKMRVNYKLLQMQLTRKGLFCLSNSLFINTKSISSNLSVKFSTHKILHKKPKVIMDKTLTNRVLALLRSELLSPVLNEDFAKDLRPFLTNKMENNTIYSFVVDLSVANDVVNKILEHKNPKSLIVEGNPGFGLITHFLLKSDVSEIRIFDNSRIRALCVDQLVNKHSDRLHVVPVNLIRNNYFNTSCLGLIKENVPAGSSVAVVGVIQSNFLHYLFHSLKLELMGGSQCEDFPMEFYVLIRKEKATGLMYKTKWFYLYCIFNLVFESEILGEYPGEAFLPQLKKGTMYLLKITIKPNAFENINRDDLNEFHLFLKIIGRSNKNYIIKTLEKWIPDCGLYLISKGISMISQTQDLSMAEAVVLFNLLKKCEGYSNLKNFRGDIGNQYIRV